MKKIASIVGVILSGMGAFIYLVVPTGISQNGINFIKKHESFSSIPYQDQGGVWTIGYGSTYYTDGRAVQPYDRPITPFQGEQILIHNLEDFTVTIDTSVKKPLTQSQKDALISFTYNVGVKAFHRSGLLKQINTDPNSYYVIIHFYKWVYVKGKISKGLLYRREKEVELYFREPIFLERPEAKEKYRPDFLEGV